MNNRLIGYSDCTGGEDSYILFNRLVFFSLWLLLGKIWDGGACGEFVYSFYIHWIDAIGTIFFTVASLWIVYSFLSNLLSGSYFRSIINTILVYIYIWATSDVILNFDYTIMMLCGKILATIAVNAFTIWIWKNTLIELPLYY